MRSNDTILANCFNICSTTLLLFIICKLTGYKPGKVVYTVNDCHIYKNQIDAFNQFKDNKPKNFPLCYIDKFENVEDLTYQHFNILFYKSHPKYSIPMAI
jgi:thymidylate synthase